MNVQINEQYTYVVFDLGNTLIKIGFFNEQKELVAKLKVPTNQYDEDFLHELFLINYHFPKQKLIIGAVNKSQFKTTINFFKDISFYDYFIINKQMHFNVDINPIRLEQIGLDLIGACECLINYLNQQSGLIFMFGTASVSLFMQQKKLIGATIAPGMEFGYLNLFYYATGLRQYNDIDYAFTLNKTIGKDTENALNSGYFHLKNGYVNSILNYVKNNYGSENPYPIFLAGNDVHFNENLDANYQNTIEYVDGMVLKGYLTIYFNNIDHYKTLAPKK